MLFHLNKNKKDNRGFTIIELIVSAGIIASLSVMVIANFRGTGQKFALENEAERLSSVIREAHINSLIGLTVNGVRPAGGFGIHITECGLQQDTCLDWQPVCQEWTPTCQGWESVCQGWEPVCQEWTPTCQGWESVCQSWESVCSSGDVRGAFSCFFSCSGEIEWPSCCCDGTWSDECAGGYEDECTGGYLDECTGGYLDECTSGYSDECTGGYVDECTGGFLDECQLYGEIDLGACRYLLFADDGDYIYNEDDDTILQDIGLLDGNIYVDAIIPEGSAMDIVFTPPQGKIYINGGTAEDDITIRLGFEKDENYKKDLIIERRTGRIDIQ